MYYKRGYKTHLVVCENNQFIGFVVCHLAGGRLEKMHPLVIFLTKGGNLCYIHVYIDQELKLQDLLQNYT